MNLIPPSQWRPLFDAVYEMNTANDHADFLSALVSGMSLMIPADLCLVHVLDRKTQRIVIRSIPEIPYTEEEVATTRRTLAAILLWGTSSARG